MAPPKPIISQSQNSEVYGLTRKEETVIHRLRIGHTRLTHSYLMDQSGPIKYPPFCIFCDDDNEIMTVRHILINCPDLRYVRQRYYIAPSMRYLFENVPQIIDFLREIGIFKKI